MKKTFLLVVMAMAALCAAAIDRFYIEDFSISAGETRTVSIMLDNEMAYTAFQTDIYLPEGLTVEQEDGDYVFDLTSRKGRDHIIASQVQVDGAIRIMSYSPSIKTYSGNSGALVTFNVTATGNVGGPTTIELKNTLFTTTSGTEIAFNDETCNVNILLKQLTGEIVFTPHGELDETIYYYEEYGYNYTSVDICYTGDEDVTFTIRGIDNDYQQKKGRSSCITLVLSDLPEECIRYDEFYYVNYEFEVVVSADGYNDLSDFYSIRNPIEPSPYDIPDLDIITTDFNVVLVVNSEWHARWELLVDGDEDLNVWGYQEDYEDGEGRYFHYIERSDESNWITVQVGAKYLEQDYFWMTSPESVEVPAINNGLEIQQCGPNGEISEDENNHFALIRYYGDHSVYYDEDEDSEIVQDYPVWFDVGINGHHISFPWYDDEGSTYLVMIDNDKFVFNEDNGVFNYGPVSYRPDIDGLIIDLLPFGDTYGGNYDIDASAVVLDHVLIVYRDYEVNAEAHLEYYVPIEAPTITTQMTNDAVIVNMSSDMDYKKLIVDGEEVLDLPYVAGRNNSDYSITVQAGHSPDSVRWAWTEETSILIPAKEIPLLRGDVDGDGSVSISDVTSLIDYLLSGNEALIQGQADVDMNGTITIADVTTLIDYLLSGNWPANEPQTETFTVNGVTFTMVCVEGGTFTMGATAEQVSDAYSNEYPTHQVTLSSYCLGETEVTQALWVAVMGGNTSYFWGDLQRPVECVFWDDCIRFISKLNDMTGKNFRLPTEAEWEYAARGGRKSQGYKYSGSNDINEVGWCWYNSGYETHPVATMDPNELGLYDMSGNVWELCHDLYGRYSSESQTNPIGPASGYVHVYRGGCWYGYSEDIDWEEYRVRDCRVSCRDYDDNLTDYFLGLRLALDPDDSPKFRLSETVVEIDVGESRTVDILYGTGNYRVEGAPGNIDVAVHDEQLTLTGVASGANSFRLVDENTGSQTTLSFIVGKVVPMTGTFTVNGVTFTMVPVEGGTFMMGASDNDIEAWDDEKPAHQVTLSSYCIGETEVTRALWRAVMGSYPADPFYYPDRYCPVEYVDWSYCQEFIASLNELTGKNFRLPTEAEWEFAARGGNLSQGNEYAGTVWCWDSSAASGPYGNYVGVGDPNELGLYDMSGNVSEWCQDWYGSYSSESQTNPTGPTSGTHRVDRGGAWCNPPEACRVTFRAGYGSLSESDLPFEGHGLRLALDLDDSPKFRLSETVVEIKVGRSKTIDILHGTGNYRVEGVPNNIDVEIHDEQLTITGVTSGTNSLTLVDENSGNQTTLSFVVKEWVSMTETFRVNGVTFTMVGVEGGTFQMGAIAEQEDGARENEKPVHEVTLSSYSIGQTEVTQELWLAVMSNNPSRFSSNLKRPVETISWEDCQTFIARLNELTGQNFRLPTEAEWEFAARGGIMSQGYKYAGSDDLNEIAWYNYNAYAVGSSSPNYGTHAVSTKAANELGLYDMTGNVWEWCQDWSDTYGDEPQTNPTGPVTGTTRIIRGGGWTNYPSLLRVAARTGYNPGVTVHFIGFRLAL